MSMKLDLVHDVQAVYRKLLDAMSRPGQMALLKDEAERAEPVEGCLPATVLLAALLLDTEVTFQVMGGEKIAEAVSRRFHQLTYAKPAETGQADYLFVLGSAEPGELERVLREAKIGTLSDPHTSATLIVEADRLSVENQLRLRGPGILSDTPVGILTASQRWLEARADRNAEYPMGLDLIFVDPEHRLLALPRTTQITDGRC